MSRAQYLNARNTFEELFNYGAVPVVNENDTVATEQVRFGDNDTLSAQVTAGAAPHASRQSSSVPHAPLMLAGRHASNLLLKMPGKSMWHSLAALQSSVRPRGNKHRTLVRAPCPSAGGGRWCAPSGCSC